MGSIVLPHLQTAWHVDQAILSEEERLVVIRFGRDHDPDCESLPSLHDHAQTNHLRAGIRQDEVLYKIAERVKSKCTVPEEKRSKSRPVLTGAWRRFRRDLPVRHRRGPRLQHHVLALRYDDHHVLLPQQAHDVRFRHGQQQQAELGA